MNLRIRLALLRQRRSMRRYWAYQCPVCTASVSWIAEAPGSTAGLRCDECRLIWAETLDGRRIRIHPYSRVA